MLIKLIIFLLLIPLVYFLRNALLGKKGIFLRFLIIFAHAILLTGFLIFFSSSNSLVGQEQLDFMKNSSLLNGGGKKKRIDQVVKNNFLAIDVANDGVAVYRSEQKNHNPEVITDRKRLSRFLSTLKNRMDLIDLIVLDIGFEASTEEDCKLKKLILDFYVTKKMILGKPEQISSKECLEFPEGIYGDVRETATDNILINHTIIKDGKYSMSYLIYQQMAKWNAKAIPFFGRVLVENNDIDSQRFILNTFIPADNIRDESFLPPLSDSLDQLPDSIDSNTSINYWQLGDFENGLNTQAFINELVKRKDQNKKNILLIGFFSGRRDLHATAYGSEHGITNIINTTVGMLENQHVIRFADTMLIFFGFFFISFISLLLLLLKKDINSAKGLLPWILINWINQLIQYIGQRSSSSPVFLFIKLLLDEIHFIVMILFIGLLYLRTGELLNGLALIIYFTFLNQITKFFIKNTTYP